MRGRENIVPGTGEQMLYLVNRRAVCARERILSPGTGEQRLYLVNRRANCAREREAVPLPGIRDQWRYQDLGSRVCTGTFEL